ncbi:hypothetical protein KIW84_054947 [Lathyrus oleraceus]|uniref:Uncharacterized protein n=1 Tax=Pisum sativum TaxID=3888 RepID=A0A9D4WUG0_PEA|nr:hypothetical protein KIW84_054947 [Pisum sativum]
MTDEWTTKKLQVSYARVIIEVDVTTKLKIKITIRYPNGAQSYIRSRLRMKTTFYNLCNTVRHECKKKEQHRKEKPIQKQVWEPKKDTHQFIYCEVYHLDGTISHNLTMIYAHNQSSQRRKLWEDIKNCDKNIQGPWKVIGDFNNVLDVDDGIGERDIQALEFSDLEEMMAEVRGCTSMKLEVATHLVK